MYQPHQPAGDEPGRDVDLTPSEREIARCVQGGSCFAGSLPPGSSFPWWEGSAAQLPAEYSGKDALPVMKQPTITGCVPTQLHILLRGLGFENVPSPQDLVREFQGEKYREHTHRGMLTNKAIELFLPTFLEERAPGRYRIEFRTGKSLDDLRQALYETGLPVLVSTMEPVIPRPIALLANTIGNYKVGAKLIRLLTHWTVKEDYLCTHYAHVVGVFRVLPKRFEGREDAVQFINTMPGLPPLKSSRVGRCAASGPEFTDLWLNEELRRNCFPGAKERVMAKPDRKIRPEEFAGSMMLIHDKQAPDCRLRVEPNPTVLEDTTLQQGLTWISDTLSAASGGPLKPLSSLYLPNNASAPYLPRDEVSIMKLREDMESGRHRSVSEGASGCVRSEHCGLWYFGAKECGYAPSRALIENLIGTVTTRANDVGEPFNRADKYFAFLALVDSFSTTDEDPRMQGAGRDTLRRLLASDLSGVDAWHKALAASLHAAGGSPRSREVALDYAETFLSPTRSHVPGVLRETVGALQRAALQRYTPDSMYEALAKRFATFEVISGESGLPHALRLALIERLARRTFSPREWADNYLGVPRLLERLATGSLGAISEAARRAIMTDEGRGGGLRAAQG